MAIQEPYDILANWPGWQTSFDPLETGDLSRQKNGVTRTRLGPMPIWRMSVVSRSLRPNQHDALKSIVQRLVGQQTMILGYSLTRCFPIAYPHGSWPTGSAFTGRTARVQSIDGNNHALRLDQLPPDFQLSEGDMLQIGQNNLHRVVEAAKAGALGQTPLFEVYPPFWPGTATGQVVSVRKPACPMRIVVGSVSAPMDVSTGRGTVSFEAMEARDA